MLGLKGDECLGKVVATFENLQEADRAAKELREKGFTDKEVSVVSKDHRKVHGESGTGQEGDGHGTHNSVATGATWGAGIGAGTALLAGAGALVVPGIGPLLAMGPLAAGLTAAAAGGLVGAFVDWGIPAQEGKHLEKEVQEGRAVVLVNAHDTRKAMDILSPHAREVRQIH